MPATRPIIREVWNSDRIAAVHLAVHSILGHGAVPQVPPGLLVTQPAIAGLQVKNGLGGGYYNPPSQRTKVEAQTSTAPGTPTT